MKDVFVIFARYNEEADKAFVAILDKMEAAERDKNRKSYFGSLSALARHVVGGTVHFLGLFAQAVPDNAAAQKAAAPLAKLELVDGKKKKLTPEQWKQVTTSIKAADKALVEFVSALNEKDFDAPVKWFGKKPATVPLSFMLQNLIAHGTHHRGQISQILDALKIDNDYSGINVKFL